MKFQSVNAVLYGVIRRRMLGQHGRWLTRALRGRTRAPRIPTRRFDEGGFARLMSTEQGRQFATRWWNAAIKRTGR